MLFEHVAGRLSVKQAPGKSDVLFSLSPAVAGHET